MIHISFSEFLNTFEEGKTQEMVRPSFVLILT